MPEPERRTNRQPEVATLAPTVMPTTTPSRPLQISRADLPRMRDVAKSLADRKPYWCGAMPLGPFQQYNFGGREFVLYEEDVQTDESGVTQRYKRAGKIHLLDDDQVKAIISAIKIKVMRGHGPGSKVLSTQHADYKPHDADHPAGEYIYFVAVSAEFAPPGYKKNEIPRGAVPVVARILEAVSA